ncbi:30S ribosomal protein THX [Pontibacter arcticus]|uniref:30S ribosomal protein THX n=1 Tax=Pontibacter arcticus TaxID=2080288 RepID=A0A364RB44_9BACT|nr:30S ribosomal protein THX [Pontibacter arcticus]RAU81475.1 30S ribosomal protein THX [Pontibacter arcticus]
MGKGDKKSKKGKISKGTFGNKRLRKANKPTEQAAKSEASK